MHVVSALALLGLFPAVAAADMEGDACDDEGYVDDDPGIDEPSYPPARRGERAIRGWDEMDEPAAWVLRGRRLVRVEAPDAPGDPEDDELPEGIEGEGMLVDTYTLDGLLGRGRSALAVVDDRVDPESGYVTGRRVRLFSGRGRRPIAVFAGESSRFGTDVRDAGDVNGDGLEDLLVTSPSPCDCCDCSGFTDDVHLYLATESDEPTERFRRATTIRGPDGMQNWIRALSVGDVNRDGRADVVVAHGEELRLHFGRAGGLEPEGPRIHRRREHSDGLLMERLPGDRPGLFWIDQDDRTAGMARRRGRTLRARRLPLPR